MEAVYLNVPLTQFAVLVTGDDNLIERSPDGGSHLRLAVGR